MHDDADSYLVMLFSGTRVSGLSGTMNVGTMSWLTTCRAVCCIGSSTVFSFATTRSVAI